jgi:hypothetical protein
MKPPGETLSITILRKVLVMGRSMKLRSFLMFAWAEIQFGIPGYSDSVM